MMKRILAVGVLMCAAVVFETVIPTAQQGGAEQFLFQLERDWCTAVMKKDGALLGQILAEDFSGVTPLGTSLTKADAIASLNDKTSTFTSCTNTKLKARVYSTAAVVTGLATESGTDNGALFTDRQTLWTDTFILKDGRWQCVANQGTRPSPSDR